MRVLARAYDIADLPPALIPFEKPGQIFVTAGCEYDVHALVVFQGQVKFLVVNDNDHPVLRAAWLFDVLDPSVPSDWIANSFRAEPSLIVGPPFIAQDLDAYARMVQSEWAEVALFWKRLDGMEAT